MARVTKVGDAFELVIDFVDQSRRLKLEPDLELKKVALALVAVGEDTLVAHSYAKQLTAWRGLSQATPERLSLVHAEAPLEAVSPRPGSLVTTGGGVSFFQR